jgi:hypothetical protein
MFLFYSEDVDNTYQNIGPYFPNYKVSIQNVKMALLLLLLFLSSAFAFTASCVYHKNTNWTQGSDNLLQ